MRRQREALRVVVAVVAAVLLGAVAPGWAIDADGDGVDTVLCP